MSTIENPDDRMGLGEIFKMSINRAIGSATGKGDKCRDFQTRLAGKGLREQNLINSLAHARASEA